MFFFNKNQKVENKSYSGSESYKYIDMLLNGKTQKIKIITPFIGNYYSKMLNQISKKNTRIYVLLSKSAEENNKEAVSMLKGQKSFRFKSYLLAVSVLYFIIIGLLSNMLNLILIELFALSYIAILLLLTALSFIYSLRRLKQNLHLKIASNVFIHEKIYIADDIAIVGSANLTYSGTHKNIEHIEVIRDRERIAELERHFDSLWSKY